MADALRLGAELIAANAGEDPNEAQIVGRGEGAVGSIGIGFAVAGRLGAGLSFGIWLFGEVMGSIES